MPDSISRAARSRAVVAVLATLPALGIVLTTPAHAAETVRVEMKDLAFSPASFTGHVGDTIEWVNDDFVAHSATARNGDWDVNLPAHQTRRTLIKRPGTIAYYCRFHPTMKGKVQVAP